MIDLSGLNDTSEEIAGEEDRIFTGRPEAKESGVYPAMIDVAYLTESKGGAVALNVVFKGTEEDFTHKEAFYIMSGRAKGRTNYYTKGGKRLGLPGYNAANSLSEIVTGKKLGQNTPEEKVVKLWDFEKREEVPTTVPVYTDFTGKVVNLGLVKVIENKRQQVDSVWTDTNEKNTKNEVDKFFNAECQTATEAAAGVPGAFVETWKGANAGKDRNKFKPVAELPTAPAGGPAVTSGSLFT